MPPLEKIRSAERPGLFITVMLVVFVGRDNNIGHPDLIVVLMSEL